MTTTPPPPEPTDDEIRVRIAAEMGLQIEVHPDPYFDGRLRRKVDYGCGWEWYDVDVLADLNACAEFEKTLTWRQRVNFTNQLRGILWDSAPENTEACWWDFALTTATPRQRALAFLATINGETK